MCIADPGQCKLAENPSTSNCPLFLCSPVQNFRIFIILTVKFKSIDEMIVLGF